jgi:RNA polymerase sigma-70 factor (ECF subfamily)
MEEPPVEDLREMSDTALVVAIGRWRQDALAEAYRRHGGAVYNLAKRVTSDPTAAQDIVQEVFLRLWNAPERHDPARGSLRTFLLVQAHGKSVDFLRSEKARRDREAREAKKTVKQGYDLESEVTDMAFAEYVKEVMSSLSDDERRAIELAYYKGLTYKEVAEELNEPEGTVKTRIRSGLRKMRESFADSAVRTQW